MNSSRLAVLASLVLAISCRDAVGPVRPLTDLDAARQRWRAQNLHTYAFTLQRSCACTNVDPLNVLVVGDTVAGAFDLESGVWVDSQLGETVEDLFTLVQNATNNPPRLIRVQYDAAKGFPTEIDYRETAQIADDEIVYHLSGVHPVPGAERQ
jgi:hypothetical protein